MKMKIISPLFIFLLAVAKGNIFEDGMEYTFDTESSALVGTMDHSPHSSGYSYKYVMRVQAHGDSIKVAISDLKLSQFNGKHEAGEHPFESTHYIDTNRDIPPFEVKLNSQGLFSSLTLSPKLTFFQRNLVKGLAQKFQLNKDLIKDHGHGFKSDEASIFGDCETLYTVTDDKIVKSVSHTKDCKNRVHVLIDDWKGHRCNIDPENPESRENPNGLYSASNTVFMFEKKGDRFSPKAIVGSSSVVAQFFGSEGVSFIAHSNSTSLLKKVKSSSGDIAVSGDTITDLKYEFEDQDYTWKSERDLKSREKNLASGEFFEDEMSNIAEFVKKRFDKISYIFNEMSTDKSYTSQAHYYGLNNIYPAMVEMDYNALKSLSEQLQADKSEEGVRKNNLFNELLGSLGTSSSAILIRDMVMENKFDNYRDAVRVLTAVPFHIRHPSKQLLAEFEKLNSYEGHQFLKDSIPLITGHLARVTCERAGVPHSPASKECFASVVDKYTDKYVDKILSSDHGEQVKIVGMLFNLRYGNLAEKLKPIIYGETKVKCGHIRSLALQASVWGAIYNGKGAEYLLPIFANTKNSHELRVTALSYLMSANPSSTHFNAILAILYREQDFEVINFAFTLLEKYSLNIDPCKQKVSSLAKYFLKYLKQYSDFQTSYGIGVSKTYARQFYQKKYGYSGTYEYWIAGSHKSKTPLVVSMCAGASLYGGYSAHGMCVSLRIEGLSKAIVRKFKTMSNEIWKVDELQKILMSDMNIKARPDQPIRVEFMLSVKGSLVTYRQYDENSIKEGGSLRNLFEDVRRSGDSYSINHQRAIRMGSLLYQQPLEIGVPMAYINSFTGVFNIQASVKRGNSRGLMYRDVKYDMNIFAQGSRIMMVQNPYLKNSYGIIQDRIYGSHFPRNFVIGVNPLKKELKLSVERPSYKNPLMVIMHSSTTIFTRSQYINDNQDISKHCDSCKTRSSLSYASSDESKTRVFMDHDCDVTGSYLHGEYFDCELPSSRGRVLYHLWKAMMPYNKSPRTIGNSIRMGIRQIRAYFVYFPRAEKCGAMIRWSQSKNKPVKEIDITMRATAGPNGEKLFFRGRKWAITTIVKAKGEPQDRIYKFIIGHEFTPGYLKNTFKIKYQRKGISGIMSDYSMCMSYQNEYPDFSEEFMGYNKDSAMKLSGEARVQYGPHEDCSSAPGEIRVAFEHLTTEEAREDMKNTWYYKKCMEEKDLPSWQGRGDRLPNTEACYLTLWDATTARKYSYKIDFVKMTDRMNAIVSQFQSVMKTGLLPYWDIDPEMLPASSAEPHMNFDATFTDNDKMVDIYMETSQGGQHFHDIPLSLNWYPLMRNLKLSSSLKRLLKYKIIDACTVTTDSVRTLDNMTYPYTPTSCWTLASGHCSSHPNFAVFTKKSSGHLDAKIYVGGHSVEFQSSGPKKINVLVDGEAVIIGDKEFVHEKEGTQIFKVLKWGSTYNVYSFLKIWVTYDGHYMNVVPAPSATGQHCGLCGNYNKNKYDEFEGKNSQRLSNSDELVEEYKWKC